MALVLGRKPNESIILIDEQDREIEIKVIKTDKDLLRLRIDAPKEYQIVRGELHGHKDVTIV